MSQVIESTAPARLPEEHTLELWDGTELFYRVWAPRVPSDKAVILLHRGHEHSGRFQDFVDRLKMDDVWLFAWDARGHGRSPGERGDAPGFSALSRDLDWFARVLTQKHDIPLENLAVVANSVGSVVAAAWVHDYAPPIRALVLAAPAFRVKLYVPLAIPGLRLLQKLKPRACIKSYVKPSMLTHDVAMAADYAADPLVSRNISVRVLLGVGTAYRARRGLLGRKAEPVSVRCRF